MSEKNNDADPVDDTYWDNFETQLTRQTAPHACAFASRPAEDASGGILPNGWEDAISEPAKWSPAGPQPEDVKVSKWRTQS